MLVTELMDLVYWIHDEIETPNLVSKYKALQQVMNQNAQPNQQPVPFEDQRVHLKSAILAIDKSVLTNSQLELLSDFKIENHVGKEGAEELENILFRNQLDLPTALNNLASISNELTNGINRAIQIREALADFYGRDEGRELAEDEASLELSFKNDASITDIDTLNAWSKRWFDAGRGLAMAHGQTPQDVRIVGAATGSLIFYLVSSIAILTTLSKIVDQWLGLYERILVIKKHRLELKQLKYDDISNELKSKEDELKKSGSEEIVIAIAKELGIKEKGDGEKYKGIRSAVNTVGVFVSKGGGLDIYVPLLANDEEEIQDDEEADGRQNLREKMREVRQLSQQVFKLEDKTGDK